MVTGEKTRPESLAVVRAEPATVQPPKKREAGRGGAEHKYLQELIRQWGQERGFRATVEHVLPAGGRVDVLLERNEISVACEVAMTTSLDHETANVEKCVVGGFNHVVVVSLRKKFLKELASAVKKGLSDSSERVKLMAPEELLSFLDELAAEPTEQNVAGYPVRVRYRLVEKTEAEARKRVMTDIIVQRLRRLKGTGS